MHDLSCKMFLFRFTKKKFEREARERNEASNNASVTLMAGVSKKLQSPTLYSVVYVKRNLVCKPGKKPTDCCGRERLVSVCNYLVTGLRQFHESGPELKRTISGHLNEILDPVEPGTRRRNHPFFGGGDDTTSTRRNIAFFAGAGPAIVQV